MAPAFAFFATAMAQAEEDETVALVHATVIAENARANADLAYVSGTEPLYYNQRVNGTIAWREYVTGNGTTTTGEVQRGGVLNLARANAYKPLDEAYATNAKTQAVAYATSEKTYYTGIYSNSSYSPNPNWWEDTFEYPRRVSKANADLTKATDQGTADVAWTAGIVAGDDVYRTEHATGVKNYQTTLADIDRDQIVAQAPHDETHTLGYLAAQTAYWTAEVAAASARRTAEATAVANWRGADYGANATAIASIDTAMGLPWTEYQSDKAAALAAWWTSDERDNFLALSAATNTAETTYQTTVNAAFTTWATNTAAAEKTFVIADANNQYDRDVLNFAADEGYEHDLVDAEGNWQNGKAANLKARRIDFWTDKRDAVANHDSTFVDTWEMRTMMGDPADAPLDRAYTIAESTAYGIVRGDKATSWRDYVSVFNTAILPYVNTTATADETYTIAESTTAAARTAAVAAALAAHDIAESQSLADAIDALSTASDTPWSAYDAALADANDAYTDSVAPALATRDTTEANSDRDYEISKATAQRILANSVATAAATHRVGVANADRDNEIGQATAELAGAQTLPIHILVATVANWGGGATPTGGQTGSASGTSGAQTGTGGGRPQTLPTPQSSPLAVYACSIGQRPWSPPTEAYVIPIVSGLPQVLMMPGYIAPMNQRTHVGLPAIASESVGTSGQVQVDLTWLEGDIEREAYRLTTGGLFGPLTPAQQLDLERWKCLIRAEIAMQMSLRKPGSPQFVFEPPKVTDPIKYLYDKWTEWKMTTRAMGGVRALGGGGQLYGGMEYVRLGEAGAGETGGLSLVISLLGVLVMAKGADNVVTGVHQVIIGEEVPTVTQDRVAAITGSEAAGQVVDIVTDLIPTPGTPFMAPRKAQQAAVLGRSATVAVKIAVVAQVQQKVVAGTAVVTRIGGFISLASKYGTGGTKTDPPNSAAARKMKRGVEHFNEKIELDSLTARQQASDLAGLGDDSIQFVSEVGPLKGWVVGRQSRDGLRGWRLDWDSTKGFHVNWWDKTANPKSRVDWLYGAIKIKGSWHDFIELLKHGFGN
jgi:hypothetical protein